MARAAPVFLIVCSIIILNCPCWCSKIAFPDPSEFPILSTNTLADIKNNDGSKFVNIYNEYVKTVIEPEIIVEVYSRSEGEKYWKYLLCTYY